jgi:signal transduction histidine kinase
VSEDFAATGGTAPSLQAYAAVRAVALGAAVILIGVRPGPVSAWGWAGALAAAAAGATWAARRSGRPVQRVVWVAEAALAGAAVAGTGGSGSPLLPYLLAPPIVAGLAGEAIPPVLAVPAAAAVALALGRAVAAGGDPAGSYAAAAAAWLALATGGAVLASWQARSAVAPVAPPDSYREAFRLLSQLRTVARQLSVGLDTLTLAEALLNEINEHAPFDRGAVFVRAGGERLMQLAHSGFGGDPARWAADLTGDNPFAEAWVSQQTQLIGRQLSGHAPGSALVLPLRSGLRTFGLVAVETGEPGAYSPATIRTVEPVAAGASLRLGSALLFEEIRELATVEERRRLAREIHDGIAQELASLGYLVDGMTADATAAGAPHVAESLRGLRREMSRVISELRLSIFDLRSDVEQHGGLGAALSNYVRTVGAASPFAVHLSLDEGPERLPTDVEAELLRIAQEAITNARKHAQARNLWVDCVIDPPNARLRIADDGVGLATRRRGSYGLEIMRERAGRLRAEFEVRSREPQGTTVEVILGNPAEVATVGTDSTAVR